MRLDLSNGSEHPQLPNRESSKLQEAILSWFFFLMTYFRLCVYVYASESHACRRPEMSEPLELDLQTVVSHLVRVLGTKLGSSASMGNT